MKLTITPMAEQDMEGIGDYIAQDNPNRALSFIQELHEHCQRISRTPLAYRQRTELGEHIRSCAHGNYVIFFDAQPEHTTIVRVLHGARDVRGLDELDVD